MTPLWIMKDHIRKKVGLSLKPDGIGSDITILSSNCTGSLILHEMGLPFNSPCVNLWMQNSDFVKFCENLDKYTGDNVKIEFIDDGIHNYPVGKLEDITIYFMHYKTSQEAEKKWIERSKRINKDNLFVMMVQRDDWKEEDLFNFDRLEYKNKVVFTYKEYPDIKSAFYIKGFEKNKSVGHLFKFEKLLSLKKYYDQFEVIKFLNGDK